MPIQILPDEVVAQIAAGEVVERPASVVKELLENALDAGAEHIRIEVTGGGRQRIRISDNGCGIMPEEAPLAFYRHATSKLRTADDLSHIMTLGFRGEALASIASVSNLTIVTRHQDAPGGSFLHLEGGQVAERKSIGAPVGTVITVENLFYNTPARMKFMKKDGTEKRHIALIVSRYAMAYPNVRFVLEQDGREVFRSNGSGYLGDVLVSALGLDTFRDMVEIHSDQPSNTPIQVYGYTSVPSLHRADRTHITLFVNGRWIQDTKLAYAVTQAYHTFLMTGRYPVSILMLTLPPEDVDVNVHPTKAEVRFRDNDAVFAAVQRAVRRAIIELAQTPAMRGGYYTEHGKPEGWYAGQTASQMDLELELESAGQFARQRSAQATEEQDSTAIPVGAGAPARPRTLPILRVVGQISATYIIAEGPVGMYLIDQHAAHERILYEQFMEEHARKGTVTQYALAAQSIHLPPVEARLIEDNLEILAHVGFSLEPFGPNTFVVRGVPALLASESPTDVLTGILEDLETGQNPGQSSIEDRIITRVCKQAAVKAGQILSLDEMQGLIRQLERCQTPLTCPHGRPTMIHMTTDQLARQFGRMG